MYDATTFKENRPTPTHNHSNLGPMEHVRDDKWDEDTSWAVPCDIEHPQYGMEIRVTKSLLTKIESNHE